MAQNLMEHHASVVVNAPVPQVYSLFSHFNDFPKFMSFVKEVTYYDDQRSHWVAEVSGKHEWDAMNDSWIPERQIGWHSTRGLKNDGRVLFQPVGASQTQVDVYIRYDPPGGIVGDISEHMGVGRRFDSVLQNDLNNFARMVDMAPANASDPNWSKYLFHPESAAARGTTTSRQNATMGGEFTTPETSGYTAASTSMQERDLRAQAPDETLINRPVSPSRQVNDPANSAPPDAQWATARDNTNTPIETPTYRSDNTPYPGNPNPPPPVQRGDNETQLP